MGEPMTPKLERLVHTLDGLRIEDFVADGLGVGRPRQKRLEMRRWVRNTNNRSSF